jgi:hypothetical protein
MIEVKDAVRLAFDFVKSLYPQELVKDLALEEVRLSDDEKSWLITVGFRALSGYATIGGGTLAIDPGPRLERVPRDYKLLEINRETGKVESMTIRDL